MKSIFWIPSKNSTSSTVFNFQQTKLWSFENALFNSLFTMAKTLIKGIFFSKKKNFSNMNIPFFAIVLVMFWKKSLFQFELCLKVHYQEYSLKDNSGKP